jgi:transcriptional antiterminator RfaH
MSCKTAQWYVVRTKPNREEIARCHLELQRFKVYLPQTIKIIKHARKTQRVKRPLFPGYLFLHLTNSEEKWTTIGSTIGTIGPLRFNTHYPTVPSQVIELLKAKEACKGYIESMGKKFDRGQKIMISEGEWQGLTGVFQTIKGSDRSIILLNLLKRQVKTDIHINSIEPL